jgi:hypothetical protein
MKLPNPDPYFKPILLATLVAFALNTLFVLPFALAPVFNYLFAGFLAIYLYSKEIKQRNLADDISVMDAVILGLCTGLLVGGLLSLVMSFKLQDPELKQTIIDIINQKMQMKSQHEFQVITELGPSFMVVTAIVTMILSAGTCFFGSILALPFFTKSKK